MGSLEYSNDPADDMYHARWMLNDTTHFQHPDECKLSIHCTVALGPHREEA